MSALQPTPQRFGSFERERQLGGVDSLSQFSFLKPPKSRRPYVSRGTSIQQRSRGRKEMIYLAKVAWRSRSSAVEDQRRAWGRGGRPIDNSWRPAGSKKSSFLHTCQKPRIPSQIPCDAPKSSGASTARSQVQGPRRLLHGDVVQRRCCTMSWREHSTN